MSPSYWLSSNEGTYQNFGKIDIEAFSSRCVTIFTGIYRDMLFKRTFNAKSVKPKL